MHARERTGPPDRLVDWRGRRVYAPNGNAVLHVKLTQPDWYLPRDPSKPGGGPVLPYEYTVQQTLDAWASRSPGGHVSIAVEPNGHLVRTNSPFVEGNRVTVLEGDVDRALDNKSFIARLRAGRLERFVAIGGSRSTQHRSAELHIYAKGGHGFAMRQQGIPVDSWTARFEDWFRFQGLLQTRSK